ncbi:D-alanyl-D-alanine carboxypeptidase [Micromonospora echinospora]|uniref:D-alanyl-D-alanine carboxypeptidase n=1 Tax=Micromonospora echinospora TaxID=1877 RepID=A0ABR6MD22_MICEC|nr:serine hydrolase domain-containing protein [Micromonospora echinospora]MBB5113275.1 D-alanyl-D-alanine carboxypeptidase [Micromonospora echinospora]
MSGAARPADAAGGDAFAAVRRVVGQRPDDEATAVVVRLTGPDGRWQCASGVADLATGAAVRDDQRFRIGGVTKTFVAATVLSLAAEGRLGLDDPVRDHLPDLLPRAVTVRRLLDHTSGLADESDVRYNDTEWFLAHRFDTFTPADLTARSLRRPLLFEPGTAQQITRANYVIAGMLVERVTGHPYADEVEARILRPLGLTATSLPGIDPTMPEPHVRGYDHGVDVTEHSPSIHGAAGEMISTVADLDRFLAALFAGEVLSRPWLAEMLRVPPGPYARGGPAFCGAGLDRAELPNGLTVWGMAGIVHGCLSGIVATPDGRSRFVYLVAPTSRGGLRVPPLVQLLVTNAFALFPPSSPGGAGCE